MVKSVNEKRDNGFFYFSLTILCLTTFPLAQGWIPLGDFIPRAFLIVVALIMYPKSFFSKGAIWLYVYFLYYIFACSIGGREWSLIGVLAQWMEFMVPIVLVTIVFDNFTRCKKVALFSLVLTIITVVLTLYQVSTHPNIVREMVGFSSIGDMESARKYIRMGVCDYSFAMIMMVMPSVFLYLAARVLKWKKLIFFGFSIIFLYFLVQVQVTTTLIIGVILYIVSLFSLKSNFGWAIVIGTLMTVLILAFGTVLIDEIVTLFDDTDVGKHLEGMEDYFGGTGASNDAYDVDYRVGLYKLSLDAFLSSPFVGSPSSPIGGHNYFLDRLGLMGVLGTLPLLLFLRCYFRKAYYSIPKRARTIYLICIVAFFALGFTKNLAGISYWTYLFLYIPCMLKWIEPNSFVYIRNHSKILVSRKKGRLNINQKVSE